MKSIILPVPFCTVDITGLGLGCKDEGLDAFVAV